MRKRVNGTWSGRRTPPGYSKLKQNRDLVCRKTGTWDPEPGVPTYCIRPRNHAGDCAHKHDPDEWDRAPHGYHEDGTVAI